MSSVVSATRPQEVADRLQQLRTEIAAKFIQMGRLLLEAKRGNYAQALGYESFDAFVWATLEVNSRKSAYLSQIVEVFDEQLDIPESELAEIGWTRLKEIAPVAKTVLPPGADPAVERSEHENARLWIEFAKHKTTSEINLQVRRALAPAELRDELRAYSTFGVGVFDDEREVIEQAIALSRLEAATDRQGRALMLICAEYIAEAKARQADAMRAIGDS